MAIQDAKFANAMAVKSKIILRGLKTQSIDPNEERKMRKNLIMGKIFVVKRLDFKISEKLYLPATKK